MTSQFAGAVWRALAVGAFVGAVPSGCGERDDDEDHRSATARSAAAGGIVLTDRPDFRVSDGTLAGDSGRFAIVSVAHALILSSGVGVVANRHELVFLDTAGRGLAVAGRRGSGPGEFASIRSIFESAEGIGAFDSQQSRLSVYTTSGDHVRDIAIEREPYRAAVGWLRDVGPVTSVDLPLGRRRYYIRDFNGAVVKSFDSPSALPSFDVSWEAPAGKRQESSPWLECTPGHLAGVIGDRIYIADQAAGRIVAVSADGRERVVYQAATRRRVTDAMLTELEATYRRDGAPPDTIAAVLRRFGRAGDPLPFAWQSLLVDPTGRLWLQVAECLPPAERDWEVVDTAGKPGGILRVRGIAVRAVRGDRVIAMTSDSLDVPYVNLFRLRPAR